MLPKAASPSPFEPLAMTAPATAGLWYPGAAECGIGAGYRDSCPGFAYQFETRYKKGAGAGGRGKAGVYHFAAGHEPDA